ncbi:MAG: hypothetical protein AAF960_11010 [Bacteroidota bacterium]
MKRPTIFFLPGLITFLLTLPLTSCDDGQTNERKPFGNCRYGAPKAIFNATIPKIEQHTFELHTQSAIELVSFDGGIDLELIQSGCEKPKQEFQFTLSTNTKSFKDGDWLASAVDMFGFMGNLAPELQPFLLWQGALKDRFEQLKIGQPQALEAGYFVKIDKIAGEDSGTLLVTLYQE